MIKARDMTERQLKAAIYPNFAAAALTPLGITKNQGGTLGLAKPPKTMAWVKLPIPAPRP
jgi:hypothetical protein